jgi:hypothetical protein
VRTPPGTDLTAPEFPPGLEWLNVAFLRMDKQMGRNAVLVEFWDFARINSLRTLPYLKAWHDRYGHHGLRVVTVQAPGYSFGRDRDTAVRAIEALGVEHPVVLDPELELWRAYGNKGWPGRYLFDRRGVLRYIHYGEGDYRACEEVIQELLLEIDDELELPPPLDPLRPEDAPHVMLEPQTADVVLGFDIGGFGPVVDVKSILLYGTVLRWRTVIMLVILLTQLALLAGLAVSLNVG